ncbi:zinc finger protein 25-like [Cydia strobilella]|uniref:zinc finger protein 25-like n=1 Tax=Cydia strobilella TaxID=1100964 RepID=UPI0030071E16
MHYHVMGSVSQVNMKPRCIPTKFACQLDRGQDITGLEVCEPSLQNGDLSDSPVHIMEHTDMQHSDRQMETQCTDQIKEESSCLDSEECSMSKAVIPASLYTNHMLEKPLCSDSTGYGVSEATKLTDELKEEVCSDGMECGMTGMSEAAILAGVDIKHDVKDELVLGSEHVKEEPLLSESVEYGKGEAAMLADLYADHIIKDELVLGPEHPHQADVSLVVLEWALADADGCLQESQKHTSATQPALQDCCVRLERPHQAASANEHTIQDTTHCTFYIEDEMCNKVSEKAGEPLCVLCGKRFALKSDLLKHVITHIHSSSEETVEQEGSQPVVADYAFEEKPAKDSQEPDINRELALRDCCVRLKRLPHHEALAGNDTAQDTTHIFEEKPSQKRVLSRDSPLVLRDCWVRLERIQHHEALAGNDTAQDTTHTGTETDTENIYASDCERELVCDLCGEEFGLKADLMRHVIIHIHVPINTGSFEPNNSQYEISTNILKENSDIDEYVCDTCRKTFHRKYNLIRHIQNTHTQTNSKIIKSKLTVYECNKEDKKTYPCDTCGIHFTQKVYLITHKRIHTAERPYSCNLCEKRFKTSGYLKVHERVHTGVKPYSCEICQTICAKKQSSDA